MSHIVQGLADPALPAAIEANLCEENAVFGRYLPGADFHAEPDLLWWITGLQAPMFNALWLAHLQLYGIDARIDRALAPFRERRVPVGWTVGPGTSPADLDIYLQAHGLVHAASQTAMAADLLAVPPAVPAPPSLNIRVVADLETLALWRRVSDAGFEASESGSKVYYDAYMAMGCGPHLPWRHYVGWLDDEPVATSSLLLHAGVAGIYGVATVPQARRQGIGAAMTLAPMQAARTLGYRVGILFPSPMGLGMYRRVGFQECCTVSHYVWSP